MEEELGDQHKDYMSMLNALRNVTNLCYQEESNATNTISIKM